MKTIFLLFFLFISTLSISQTKEDTTVMWFKYIHKVDESYLKQPFIRHQIYINNLGVITKLIINGDLKISLLQSYTEKSKFHIKYGFDVTFIHVLRNNPELILNNEVVSFLENEIKNNDFDKTLLTDAIEYHRYNLTYYQGDKKHKKENTFAKKMSHQYDSLFFEALKRWGIEELVNKREIELNRKN